MPIGLSPQPGPKQVTTNGPPARTKNVPKTEKKNTQTNIKTHTLYNASCANGRCGDSHTLVRRMVTTAMSMHARSMWNAAEHTHRMHTTRNVWCSHMGCAYNNAMFLQTPAQLPTSCRQR
jgi:hypothetical protein